MFNIASFLEKISKNLKSVDLNKDEILNVIKSKTNLDLNKEDLEYKEGILYIKSSPAVKNKIFIFKKNILDEIKSKISINIVDIR